MVAYSFKPRFVVPIRAGLGIDAPPSVRPKRQTIRAVGKRRHARPGEQLQLYQGMRTRECFLIGRAKCKSVHLIQIDTRSLSNFGVRLDGGNWLRERDLLQFVQDDGFDDDADMLAFWNKEHPNETLFDGVCVRWEPLPE